MVYDHATDVYSCWYMSHYVLNCSTRSQHTSMSLYVYLDVNLTSVCKSNTLLLNTSHTSVLNSLQVDLNFMCLNVPIIILLLALHLVPIVPKGIQQQDTIIT
jgi:hypothetical protein